VEVVADSNVFVSALVYGGKPLQLLELGLDREIHLVTSLSIVEETLAVLERKFSHNAEQLREARARIEAACYGVFRPALKLQIVADDPDDDKVLELAALFADSVVVTGDRHLLRLGQFRGIRILRPAEFLSEFETPRT